MHGQNGLDAIRRPQANLGDDVVESGAKEGLAIDPILARLAGRFTYPSERHSAIEIRSVDANSLAGGGGEKRTPAGPLGDPRALPM